MATPSEDTYGAVQLGEDRARAPTLRRVAYVAAGALLVGAAAAVASASGPRSPLATPAELPSKNPSKFPDPSDLPPCTGGCATTDNHGPPAGGAAVCVTGELERFVSDSKLENLVKPLADFYQRPVDVVLVLSTAAATYTNGEGTVEEVSATPNDVVDFFRANPNVDRVWFEEFSEPPSPVVNQQYAAMLVDETRADREAHAANHHRMFYHYTLCGRRLARFALERGEDYKMVVNTREDNFFLSPIDAPAIQAVVRPGSVATQAFDMNKILNDPTHFDAERTPLGLNDKVTFYDFANLEDVCAGPMDTMLAHFDFDDIIESAGYSAEAVDWFGNYDRIKSEFLQDVIARLPEETHKVNFYDLGLAFNSESFLDYTYRRMRSLQNFRLPPTELAAVPYKIEEDGAICLHVLKIYDFCNAAPDLCDGEYSKAPYALGNCARR